MTWFISKPTSAEDSDTPHASLFHPRQLRESDQPAADCSAVS